MGETHGKQTKKKFLKVLYCILSMILVLFWFPNEVDSPINLIIPMALLDERGRGWDIFSLTRSA